MSSFDDRFLLKCKKCGYEFYPWKAFMITSDNTNWKPFLYCPQCHSFDDKENFKKN